MTHQDFVRRWRRLAQEHGALPQGRLSTRAWAMLYAGAEALAQDTGLSWAQLLDFGSWWFRDGEGHANPKAAVEGARYWLKIKALAEAQGISFEAAAGIVQEASSSPQPLPQTCSDSV